MPTSSSALVSSGESPKLIRDTPPSMSDNVHVNLPAASTDLGSSPSTPGRSRQEVDPFETQTESLCWPSCYNCGRCLDPEIPPCFCPYCAAFNT